MKGVIKNSNCTYVSHFIQLKSVMKYTCMVPIQWKGLSDMLLSKYGIKVIISKVFYLILKCEGGNKGGLDV